jgi:2-dehydro-3-deoxy-D-arabinonate dehydratase
MKLCRFSHANRPAAIGLIDAGETVLDLTPAGIVHLNQLLESLDLPGTLRQLSHRDLPQLPLGQVRLLAPVDHQEVWAAGVTYLRSKKARMDESDFSASAYDKVYEAERPEIFFKSMPQKLVASGEPAGIRSDARWNVPEPELALILNSRAQIAGYTIGNDMSSRDIEGENLLYLPQAKVYHRSCALGPWIMAGITEQEARSWDISLEIHRENSVAFTGETSVAQIKRSFSDLAAFLFRCQQFPAGAVLLTGTGIVPPDTFSLQPGDRVVIRISGIGTLENVVCEV